MLKLINLVLSFALELCLLAAFGYWGFQQDVGPVSKILLSLGIPLAVAVIWGIFLAPASKNRLPGVARSLLQILLFGLAVSALYSIRLAGPAVILGSLFLLNKVLAIVWGQDQLST